MTYIWIWLHYLVSMWPNYFTLRIWNLSIWSIEWRHYVHPKLDLEVKLTYTWCLLWVMILHISLSLFFHSILDVSPHLFLPLHSGITSTIPYVSFLYHNTHGFLLCPGFESQPPESCHGPFAFISKDHVFNKKVRVSQVLSPYIPLGAQNRCALSPKHFLGV